MKCLGVVRQKVHTQAQLRLLQCLVSAAAASVERALLWPSEDNPDHWAVALLEPLESITHVLSALATLQLPDHLRTKTSHHRTSSAKSTVSSAAAAPSATAASTDNTAPIPDPVDRAHPFFAVHSTPFNVIVPCPNNVFRMLITPEPPLPFLKRRTAASVAWLLMAQSATCLRGDSLENRCAAEHLTPLRDLSTLTTATRSFRPVTIHTRIACQPIMHPTFA